MVWDARSQVNLQLVLTRIINKVKMVSRLCLFFIFLLFSLTACVTVFDDTQSTIYDTWKLEKVIYDDNSEKILEQGNFVKIHKNFILVIYKDFGNRRYEYVRNNNILNLASGDSIITWEIILHTNQELQIKTPIGLYILKP